MLEISVLASRVDGKSSR